MNKKAGPGHEALNEQVTSLRALKSRRPTPERHALLAAAVGSKFEGVQSVALEVLGAWGDDRSVDLIKQVLEKAFERPTGWSIRGVAIRALAPRLRPRDTEWVLELYFSRSDQLLMHELLPLFERLAPDAVRKRFTKELRSSQWTNRQAAVKAIGIMPFPDKKALVLPLSDDPVDHVRDSARAVLAAH